jgi:flagellar export protein FliJ
VAESFRLRSVLELAQWRLESATMQLRQLAARRDEAQTRLDQLQDFLQTYRQDLKQAMETGVELVRFRDFQAFLAKLERAIVLQAAELQRCQSTWEAEHRRWLDLRAKEQAFSVLEKRHEMEQTLREGRREQKQQDELSLRNGNRREPER